MMRSSHEAPRRRALRKDEIALWRAVTRHVAPFAGREHPEPAPEVTQPQTLLAADNRSGSGLPDPPVLPPAATSHARDRKLLTSVAVRKIVPQARIDLHGMRQVEAHSALSRFLRRAHGKGHRIVLVITGKGDGEGDFWWEGRGVLRRNLPNWLDTPEMKALVVGYQEAAQQHGGAGAFYVQLRKSPRTMDLR
jgi:DNA-nicking Smr family endonuclease